jgi:rhodanese-related sulfurtransferase
MIARPLLILLLPLLLSLAPAGAVEPLLLDAPSVYDQVRAGERLLIDVRSPSEWQQTGLPAGAAALTIHDPGGLPAFVAAVVAYVDGELTTPVAVICASGVRSTRAQQLLAEAGFVDVVNVREGMFGSRDGPGWLNRGLPTDPCLAC